VQDLIWLGIFQVIVGHAGDYTLRLRAKGEALEEIIFVLYEGTI
jgi:hypothetical protein